jgi:RNA polymerase sigma-70 factor (ECF subfamily)
METYASIPTEELLRRCGADEDARAWDEFVRRFHRPIATVVLRMASRWGDSSRQTGDDLVQETYLKLCANNYRILRQFEHRSPEAFTACVKVIAANVVRDHFKFSYSQKRGSNKVDGFGENSLLAAGEDSAGGVGAIERSVLMQDVQRHLDVCLTGPDRERNNRIFWLYYRVGMSAASIAELSGVALTTKGVESLILRMTRDLRARMAQTALPGDSIALETASGVEGIREAVPRDSNMRGSATTCPGKGILPAESF